MTTREIASTSVTSSGSSRFSEWTGSTKELSTGFLSHSTSSASAEASGKRRRRPSVEDTCTNKSFTSDLQRLRQEQQSRNARKSTDELTINKPRYWEVGLLGREEEVQLLRNRIKDTTGNELVLIGGASGTGKTSLALTAMKTNEKGGPAFLCVGKFDLYLRDEPYAAIIDALDGLIMGLRESGSALLQEISSELGPSELGLLAALIPNLEKILPPGQIPTERELRLATSSGQTIDSKTTQLNYAFRKLVRRLCRCNSNDEHGLVIVLDDLQWADVQSLDLLQVLLTDPENSKLVIVGCYRTDHTNDEDGLLLAQTLEDLRSRAGRIRVTELAIGNLPMDVVNEIVMALLAIDDPAVTRGLAEICFRRTHGNAFFLLAFVTMLYDEELLRFRLDAMEWHWVEATIEDRTVAAANIVDLLTHRISRIAKREVVRLLQVASCLGSEFDERILRIAWFRNNNRAKDNDDKPAFEEILRQVVGENYLEANGLSRYRWVHDKVQEAAASLMLPDELSSLKWDIGLTLLEELNETELDAVVFVVANLLNKKHDAVEVVVEKNVTIATLNLRAAEKAKEGSAFASAGRYATAGIRLLPVDKWENHFRLALDLYSIGAEASGIRGNVETMETYSDEVLKQSSCTVFDKLRAYNILMESRASEGRFQEALNLCLGVLEQLGCKFPTGLGQIARVVSTISKLKKNVTPTKEEIRRLPRMTDRKRIESMNLMKMLGTYCMMTGNDLLMLLVLTRQYRWTMRYGLDTTSPPAFNGYGMILMGVLGDFQAANHYADLALSMLELLDASTIGSATLYGAHYLLLPWRNPIHNSLKPLQQGFEMGMQVGDSESACYCLCLEAVTMLAAGKMLPGLDANCRMFVPHMEELKRTELADMTRLCWQVAQNLMGYADNPTVLVGDAADEHVINERSRTKKSSIVPFVIDALKSYVCAYTGEYEVGATLAIDKGDTYLKKVPASSFGMWETFARGISLYAMARKTSKWKYKRHALRVRKTIQSWSDNANPNVNHHLLLLDAEQAALDGKTKEARALYGRAVSTAARGGFIHDAALANERYLDFVFGVDHEESTFRLGEALRFYSEWGASYKLEVLSNAYRKLLPGMDGALESALSKLSDDS